MINGMMEVKDIRNINKRQKFYRAVIENYKDPEKLGRVKVRIVGLHNWDTGEVPTSTLPWAEVLTDNMYGLNAGVGTSAIPLQGTWCWVFFDNDDYNYPIIFGLISGKAVKPDDGGFKDPDGKYPYQDRLDEPDMHRLCRVEKLDETIKKDQEGAHDKNNDGEFDSGDLEFPEIHDKAKYPDNTVQETATGHHFITDDTPGNERIFKYHRTGTFIEWRPDGSTMYKTFKDKHESTNGHFEEHIIGYMQTIIEKYNKVHIKEYRETVIDKYEDKIVGEDYTRTIGGNDTKEVSKKGNHKFGDTYTVKASKIFLN